MSELKQLKKWVEDSDNIVFLGGAGVSTESGIPDFHRLFLFEEDINEISGKRIKI